MPKLFMRHMIPEVLMTKAVFFDVEDYEKDFLQKNCNGKYDYYLLPNPLNDISKLDDDIKDADIISCFTTSRVSGDILKNFSNLKLIALRSVGFNHIDLDYCKEHNISVVNTPNYGNKSVAEFAFGLMLDVCRKITKACIDFRNMNINPLETIGIELGGKTVGIIGLGAIGAEFARISYGFDMNILGYDINQRDELIDKYEVEYTDFDTLLANSDFISLHSPLTKDNFHMFSEDSFKKMKPSSILINTARGELIDTQALYNALINKEISGAGLDVLESEETISDTDYLSDISMLNSEKLKDTILNTRLFQMENVIITPHIAYNTKEAINRILSTTIENINAFLSGKIKNKVD